MGLATLSGAQIKGLWPALKNVKDSRYYVVAEDDIGYPPALELYYSGADVPPPAWLQSGPLQCAYHVLLMPAEAITEPILERRLVFRVEGIGERVERVVPFTGEDAIVEGVFEFDCSAMDPYLSGLRLSLCVEALIDTAEWGPVPEAPYPAVVCLGPIETAPPPVMVAHRTDRRKRVCRH